CARTVTADVSARVLPLHKTALPGGSQRDVLHHFWVEVTNCPACGFEFEVHPHYLLAFDKANKVQWAFCRSCHEVAELAIDAGHLACPCGTRTDVQAGTLSQGKLVCPKCGGRSDLAGRGREAKCPPVWRLFAQEYVEPGPKKTRKFKKATDLDRANYT